MNHFFLGIMAAAVAASLQADALRQKACLDRLLRVLPPSRADRGRVTPLDATWEDWLRRTGELPPDFSAMPSMPFLPDPLVWDEGRSNTPIRSTGLWEEKREWMRRQIQHWITGTIPPPPGPVEATLLGESSAGGVRVQRVELRFGPDRRMTLHLELYLPPGPGPFPVFMTPGARGSSWISIGPAVERGYAGCLYAACDAQDDTEAYAPIYYPKYDFTRLMRRAWGASRAIDYLQTLPEINPRQIALAGLSRDGRQALMAAAFEERIGAAIICSGGTGGEDPYRYTSEKFDNESIAEITSNFPYWLHPRLRFFIGREDKLPVDANSLMALAAPRGLLITSSIFESQGNPWGIEQAFDSAEKVYRFLGAGDQIGLYLRESYHPPARRDVQVFVDFCDHIFHRGTIPAPRDRYYDYSFSKWEGASGEAVDPRRFPKRGLGDLLQLESGGAVETRADWERKREEILREVRWSLGDAPPRPPARARFEEDYLRTLIGQPKLGRGVGMKNLGAAALYFPANENGAPAAEKMPALIFIHEYAYPTGYARRIEPILKGILQAGYAVLVRDEIGFGTRVPDGRRFYQRYPHWSKLGRMIQDLQTDRDQLEKIDFIDARRIYAGGYALGGTVALIGAALEPRLAGAASIAGFTSLRLDIPAHGQEGLQGFSHLHGLWPRLGFFAGEEERLPFDFHEIIASIAPRPTLLVAPQWDRDANLDHVKECAAQARRVYALYRKPDALALQTPANYNQFPPQIQQLLFDWLRQARNAAPPPRTR